MAQAIRWDLIADPRRFQRGFREAERTSDRFARTIHRVGGLVAGAFAGVAVTQVFKGFLEEGREAQLVGRQTAAVIKSTGKAAGLTAKQFSDLAESLSDYAAVDDEVVQGGENILATFTRIKAGGPERVFERASKAALDMAAAMGHGEINADNLQAANLRLGKALNDPLRGMTALTRVGVTFSDQQRKQIKNFVEAGDVASAQGVILDEVAKEFGGSAAASATGWDRFRVALGNFQEFVGTALLPLVDKAGRFLGQTLVPALERFARRIRTQFGPALGDLTGVIQEKFDTFSLDAKVFGRNLAAKIKGTAQAVIVGFQVGLKTGDWSQLGAIIGNILRQAIGNGADLMARAFGGVDWFEVGKAVGRQAFSFGLGFVSTMWDGVIDTFKSHPVESTLALAMIIPVGKAFGLLGKLLKGIPILRRFAPIFESIAGLAAPMERAASRLISFLGRGLGEGMERVFPIAGKRLRGLLGDLIAWVSLRFEAMRAAARRLIFGLAVGIGEQVGLVARDIGRVIAALTRPFIGIGGWLVRRGVQLILGLISGIRSALGSVGGVLRTLRDTIVGGIKRLFGIASPSRVMAGLGASMVAGLVRGLIRNQGTLRAVLKSISGNILDWFGGALGAIGQGGTSGPVQLLAQRMAAGMGWTGNQWAALRQLVQNESGWNPNAQNPTSSAYGLFQFLNSTWASVGATKTSSPVGQIAAGLRYIKQRYGTPIGALSFWNAHHWYGQGLAPSVFNRPTLIGVGERGPEAVSITPLHRAARGMGADELADALVRALERYGLRVAVDDIHTGLLAKKRGQGRVKLGLD